MTRYSFKLFTAAAIYLLLLGCGSKVSLDESQESAAPSKLTLYSIDFREVLMEESEKPKDDNRERIAGWPVIGKIEISDPQQRKEIMDSIREAIRKPDEQKKCFWPRHFIRVVEGAGTTEIGICFECRGYAASGAHPSDGIEPISNRPEELLNKILKEGNIEVLPKSF